MGGHPLMQNAPPTYVCWRVPELPAITLPSRVAEGIQAEVLQSFNAIPKRGAEAGGILLGRRVEDGILIEDFKPVACEHRFGPSYLLSPADYDGLRKTLEWVGSQPRHGLSLVGFYRSHTRTDFSLSVEDAELFSESFPGPEQVFLLIKPSRFQQSVADFFFRRHGGLAQGLHVVPFPFEESAVPPRPAPPSEPKPQQATTARSAQTREVSSRNPAEPPVPVRKPPQPTSPLRPFEEPALARSYWPWGTAAAILIILAAALGYRSMRSHVVPPEPLLAPPPPVLPVTPAAPDTKRAQPVAAEPEPKDAQTAAIRSLLDHWAAAIQQGNVEAAVRYYAPRVTNYLGHGAVRSSEVRARLRYMHGRYGRLVLNRISDVSITPVGRDAADVSFRRHWQSNATGSPSSGDTQERLTLVHTEDGWKIASEQETPAH